MGGLVSKPKAPQVPQTLIQAAAAPPPVAPTPAPVTPMPDAGDTLTQAENRRKQAQATSKSGRLSTILDNSDTLG